MKKSEFQAFRDLATEFRKEADSIQPHVVLGDEDSIFLSPKQVGEMETLKYCAEVLEKTVAIQEAASLQK